jgi:pre-rRNA-processing protein TSR1
MARNKAHKQRFASKHTLADKSKGRQVRAGQTSVKAGTSAHIKERSKQAAAALREKRAKAALAQRRIGSADGFPRIVGVIPANESGNTEEVLQGFCKSLNVDFPGGEQPFSVVSKEKKSFFTFICEKNCNDQDCIDVAKVSDFLVLTLDCSQSVQNTILELQEAQGFTGDDGAETIATTWFSDVGLCITDFTRDLVSAVNSQGAPSVVVVIQNLHTFPDRQRQKVLKIHQRYFNSVLSDATRVVSVIDEADYANILRHIQVSKVRALKWRDQHPYMVVEGKDYDEAAQEFTITGYLRGMPLSATQLIHLTNYGTYQISKVEEIVKGGERRPIEASEEEQRESLQQVQANSSLEDEGMPTDADVLYHQELERTRKIRVPAGASSDQAAWYDTAENVVEDEVPEQEHIAMDDEDAFAGDAMSYRTTQTDVDFLKAEDVIRLERMTDEERIMEMEKLKELSEEEAWNPDMVDTPVSLPARQRFAKYRGMKSFHTGKWDPAENLPARYAYVYKLQGYSRIRESAIEACEEGMTDVGMHVAITLENVPKSVSESSTSCLLIASGQLQHEQKWSVLHFQVQRASELDEPIKSKTPMLAHIGFRKFYVSPLFSDISSGDRSKFARFFHEGDKFRMASFFGPISYNPCPVLLFQVPSLEEQNEGNPLRLACFGGALPPNPDTLLLKRAVLTGRVAVIHKKQIVVKYMFFNDEDVKWFQPVDLYTKFGRRGKITKAVGTHGLFKAVLNDQIMQHDVVCMDLYKRVFPKWTTVAFNIVDVADTDKENEEE